LKVGIISDSHDNLPAVQKAISILNSGDLDYVLHAGDIVSPFTAKLLADLKSAVYVTFGNNDGERIMLKEVLCSSGNCTLIWPKLTVQIGKYRIALTHGEDEEAVEALAYSGKYDLVIYGHSHKTSERRVNNSLLVNPGELCGYLTGYQTLAITDLEQKRVIIKRVDTEDEEDVTGNDVWASLPKSNTEP